MLAVALVAASCAAQREIVVTSEPVGAEVRVDGEVVGHTPLTLPFLHYGARRVTLVRDGYLSHSEVLDLEAPWYAVPGMDFFSEILFPIGWHDRHEVHAVLEPVGGVIAEPDLDSVLRRAEELRRAGPGGPLTPVPAPESAPADAATDGSPPPPDAADEPDAP